MRHEPCVCDQAPVAMLTWSVDDGWKECLQSRVKMPILTDGLTPPRAQQEAQIEIDTTGPKSQNNCLKPQGKTKTWTRTYHLQNSCKKIYKKM